MYRNVAEMCRKFAFKKSGALYVLLSGVTGARGREERRRRAEEARVGHELGRQLESDLDIFKIILQCERC